MIIGTVSCTDESLLTNGLPNDRKLGCGSPDAALIAHVSTYGLPAVKMSRRTPILERYN
jgi:hypothetical protein